jgi:D-beta-D-heptose 7-phosphate kinase / D-beta-D-heptose 1-phosphate adenosyltransferase
LTPAEILEKIQGARIAVVGDAMVDHYVFGRVERICPEAPVPIFIPERNENRPGGAANVARQLMQLGCEVYQAFAPEFCIKTRYMAGQQLVLRVDEDKVAKPDLSDVTGVANYVAHLKFLDAVILSDYAKGWLSPAMCRAVIDVAIKRHVPVVVDPKGNEWGKFVGCDLICPSTSDGFTGHTGYSSATFPDILLKCGADGMQLSERGEETVALPTTARHVADVTGAGDCIVAVVAAAIAVGARKREAATLAALAAGWCVGEVGTVSCSRETLKGLINAVA